MYIRTETPGASVITIREIDGDRLDTPITVEFSEEGLARVKAGVGEWMVDCDRFPDVEIHQREEHDSDEEQEE